MPRLPQPGGDSGNWGTILNDFLSQAHNVDGSLRSDSVGASQLQSGAMTKSDIGLGNVDNTSDSAKPVSTATQTALDLKASDAKFGNAKIATGLDTTGATDVSAALQALLNEPPVHWYGNIVLLPGKYKCSTGLIIDLNKAGIIAPYGAVTLDFSGMSSGVAIDVGSSANVPTTASPSPVALSNLVINGPGKVAGTTGIRLGQPSGAGQVRGMSIQNTRVRAFGIGETYRDNAWGVAHTNFNVANCSIGLSFPASATNAGERLYYNGCVISGCDVGIECLSYSRFHLVGCSLDFNDRMVYVDNAGHVDLFSCHLEGNADTGTVPIYVGPNSTFTMTGGHFLCSDDTPTQRPAYIVDNQTDVLYVVGSAFHGVKMHNLVTTTNQFSGGPGNTIVRDCMNYNGAAGFGWKVVGTAASLVRDDTFADSSGVVDAWSIIKDATVPTDRLTGTRGTIARSAAQTRTGTGSMVIEKTGALNQPFSAGIAVPITRYATASFQVWLRRTTAAGTGTFTVTPYFATCYYDSNQVLRLQQTLASGGNNLTDYGAMTQNVWLEYTSSSQARRAPAWATHYFLEFDLTSCTSATRIYVDDVIISEC